MFSIQKGSAFYNAYEKDIAVVNIFFGGSTAFGKVTPDKQTYYNSPFSSEFERSQKMTWLDFIANLGGLCGLCLGISFVSVVELAYWFIIRLSENCLKKPL